MVALHLAQVFGNARPRGSDDARDVLVAEGNRQQGAPRILDAEVVAQIEHRDRDALVKIEVQQARSAAQ